MRYHPSRDFDFTLIFKLMDKNNKPTKYYAKFYLDLRSKQRNEAAIKLLKMEYKCMKIAENDNKVSIFVPNYFILATINTMMKHEKKKNNKNNNIFDLNGCTVLITSDCGVAIDRIPHFTYRERDCIVYCVRCLVSNMKCDEKFKHGEIDAKHILVNDKKEIKLIDFDATSMYIAELDYEIGKNFNIDFDYILSVLDEISFEQDKLFCDDDQLDGQDVGTLFNGPQNVSRDSCDSYDQEVDDWVIAKGKKLMHFIADTFRDQKKTIQFSIENIN